MKTFWKKAGWTVLTLLPVLVSLAGQLLVGAAVMIVYGLLAVFQAAMQGITDHGQLEDYILERMMDGTALGILIYHVIAVVLFGVWYYFGCGKPKPVSPAKVFRGKTIPVTVILGFGMCACANAMVLAAEYVVPQLIQEYMELAEAAGLGTNVFTIVASVLIAPVGEEILCRGITFHYAGKVVEGMKSKRAAFWIANGLQAFCFGVMHGNLVQGVYAFVLGLCLGWLRFRYNSLYPAMAAHFLVNFSSTFVIDPLLALLPVHPASYVLLLLGSIGIMAAAAAWDRKPLSVQ